MAIIKYLENEQGEQQAFDEISKIAEKGKEYPLYAELASFILQGLDLLEDVGVPPDGELILTGRNAKDHLRTFKIYKPLKHHSPLMEFRINWEQIGAFRAIFFSIEKDGKEILYFTRSLIKQSTSDPAFDKIIEESELMFRKFMIDQNKGD
ncbi:hypothetical protein [Halalkalibacillus halophilus]|uniref:hypothetical protein n=1 Tax=Halalkalibacillus halophilus TaxID=392827 RepID=UPI0004194430|nr:hypothetical protein [Halalkalibacillus halophilus]